MLVSALGALRPATWHRSGPAGHGARIYSSTCSVCHGPDGDQVSGVELKKGQFRRASTDDELARLIQNGMPGTAMPPNNINSGGLVALVAYLHAMRDFKTKKVAMGDARNRTRHIRGKRRLRELPPRQWQRVVHSTRSERCRVLSALPAYLEDALLDPKSTDLPQIRFIRAVTRNGTSDHGTPDERRHSDGADHGFP